MAKSKTRLSEQTEMAHGRGGTSYYVEPRTKGANLRRLKRIEGQVRGLQRMVEEERYCADILDQLSAVCKALHSVGNEVLRNHLRHCATKAIKAGSDKAEVMYDELIELMRKNRC